MRLTAVAAAAALLTGCAHDTQQHAQVTAHPALSSIQVTTAPIRNGVSGAPTQGLRVSGTITNTGATSLRCRPTEFFLIDAQGNAIAPTSQWCDLPAIAPRQSGSFNATFNVSPEAHVELRFEHPDGTYESHPLTPPPA